MSKLGEPSRLSLKEHYFEQLKAQSMVIEQMDALVEKQRQAVTSDDLDLLTKLCEELRPLTDSLQEYQQEIDLCEQQIMQVYEGVSAEQGLAEMNEALQLRIERTKMLEAHVAGQEALCEEMASYLDGLVAEGRDINQSMQAFYGYRKAARLDNPLLNVRK